MSEENQQMDINNASIEAFRAETEENRTVEDLGTEDNSS